MSIHRVLFCNLKIHYPFGQGGAYISRHNFLYMLHQRGIEVRAIGEFNSLSLEDIQDSIKKRLDIKIEWEVFNKVFHSYLPYLSTHVCHDLVRGYIYEQVERLQPDLMLSTHFSGLEAIAEIAERNNIPLVLHISTDDLYPETAKIILSHKIPVVVNSYFMKMLFQEAYGFTAEVFYPCFDTLRYKTHSLNQKKYITFINPVLLKGVETFLKIAEKMPEENFLCVEGWGPPAPDELLRINRLSNIRYLPYTSDMRKIYEDTKILLVPSIWEEPFGRVIIEAQINGIPVIASERGGIEEALGKGGILIPYDRVEQDDAWIGAIKKLDDPVLYKELSGKAVENVKRFDIYANIETYAELLENFKKGFV